MANEDLKKKVDEEKAQLAADQAQLEAEPAQEPAPSQEPVQATTEVAVVSPEPSDQSAPSVVAPAIDEDRARAMVAVATANAASGFASDHSSHQLAADANMAAADALFAIGEDGGPFYLRAQSHRNADLFKGV